jgi:hypothetical protein
MKKNKKKSLLQKLKDVNGNLLKLVHRKIEYVVGPVVLLVIVALVMSTSELLNSNTGYNLPKNTKSFADTSVRIMNFEMNSGGSGVILKSSPQISTVLTNKHVCKLIEMGGLIEYKNRKIAIRDYQKYKFHDLCLIRVMEDLKINTKIADTTPESYSDAFISGHPALLPHVLSPSSFSDKTQISMITSIRPCKESEMETFECQLFGAMPVVEVFNTQLVTGTILPGSSGSAVFNRDGEISGLVFAGNGRGFSYAFIVPQEYIQDFISSYKDVDFKQASPIKSDTKVLDSIFNKNAKKACLLKHFNSVAADVCSKLTANIIWVK